MKTTTAYMALEGRITVTTKLPEFGKDYWHTVNGVHRVSVNGGPFVPDPEAGQVDVKGPYRAEVLQEIIAWEQAGQPEESKPKVLRNASVVWTEIS